MVKKLDAIKIYEIAESGNTGAFYRNPRKQCTPWNLWSVWMVVVDGLFSDSDVDECAHYGICDQRCENLKGSYRCYCDAGYKLQDDKRTCKVEGVLFFYASSN